MDFFSDSADSFSSDPISPSADTAETIGSRGFAGLKRKLKLQPISSSKITFRGDKHPGSNDDLTSPEPVKSSTLKRKFHDLYTPLEVIGQGSCGIVKKVQSLEDNQIYVAKIIRGHHQEHIDQIKREYQILSKLQHKNIVKAKELLVDEALGSAQLILEYVQGKTLEELIFEKGRLEEEKVRYIVEQLTSALKHVHDKGVCHRDITASNIIINENFETKLIDFSISKIFREELFDSGNLLSASLRKKSSPLLPGYHNFMMSNTGTDYYKAPEVVTGTPYNQSVDMWSLGVITFYALAGYKPFQSKTIERLYDKISNAEYKMDEMLWADISNEAVLFVKNCLKQFPFIRLSTKEALYHPWIRRIKLNLEGSARNEKKTRSKHLSPPARSAKKEQCMSNTKSRKSFILDISELN